MKVNALNPVSSGTELFLKTNKVTIDEKNVSKSSFLVADKG